MHRKCAFREVVKTTKCRTMLTFDIVLCVLFLDLHWFIAEALPRIRSSSNVSDRQKNHAENLSLFNSHRKNKKVVCKNLEKTFNTNKIYLALTDLFWVERFDFRQKFLEFSWNCCLKRTCCWQLHFQYHFSPYVISAPFSRKNQH